MAVVIDFQPKGCLGKILIVSEILNDHLTMWLLPRPICQQFNIQWCTDHFVKRQNKLKMEVKHAKQYVWGGGKSVAAKPLCNMTTSCCYECPKEDLACKNKLVLSSHNLHASNLMSSPSWLGPYTYSFLYISLFRKWRKAQPITFLSSSEIPAANSERFIPWTLKPMRWHG